jgi:hypothetical protein
MGAHDETWELQQRTRTFGDKLDYPDARRQIIR